MSIRVVEQTSSTQDDVLADLARDGSRWPHLSGLRAREQTAGRGRTGRGWETRGVRALTVSFVVRPHLPVEQWGTLALRAGVAVVRALAVHGVTARLKWPNDIVVEADTGAEGWHGIAKVGGILGTLATDSRGEAACVLGIGVNLEGEVPVDSGASVGGACDADSLAATIREELAVLIPRGPQELEELGPLMVEHCHTLGKSVVVTFPREVPPRELRGTAVRVDPDGALVVVTEVGEERILNGDVAHTRLRAPLGWEP